MVVGKLGEKDVTIGGMSPNHSTMLVGISGSGKTCRLQQIELNEAINGGTVIVIDAGCTHEKGQIFAPIEGQFTGYANRISAVVDGIDLRFLQLPANVNENMANYVNRVNLAVGGLAAGNRMGAKQMSALRTAIVFAMKNSHLFSDEMSAIASGLLQQETQDAQAVYEKLWTVLNCGVFRTSAKHMECGKINIIDFAGIDYVTKNTLVEMLLADIWKNAQFYGQQSQREMTIVCDEFQKFSLKPGSALTSMLREGRKFHVNLLLATQSLNGFAQDAFSMLNQTAIRLYFKQPQTEARKLARMFERDQERWYCRLTNLRVGESVALGNFELEGRAVQGPLILN